MNLSFISLCRKTGYLKLKRVFHHHEKLAGEDSTLESFKKLIKSQICGPVDLATGVKIQIKHHCCRPEAIQNVELQMGSETTRLLEVTDAGKSRLSQ